MVKSKPISLKVLDNGPIKVSGEKLSVSFCGEPVAVEDGKDVYLCRCGNTGNPPFCDGSHSRVGFVADPPREGQRDVKVWQGRTIRTYFNPNACMHVFYCKPLKELRAREEAGDDEAASAIARAVMQCPSGALTYESIDVTMPAPGTGVDLDIQSGGEVRVQTDFEINAELHERQPSDRATLCRCGLSKNKPWCDGRHRKREGFR